MNVTNLSGRFAAPGHLVVFNRKDLVAEKLPQGVFRVTRKTDNAPPMTVVVSPLAGKIAVGSPKGIVVPMDPSQMRKFGIDQMVTEGKTLLEAHGIKVEEDSGVKGRLEDYLTSLQSRPGINPLELDPGDRIGIFMEKDGACTLTILQLAGKPYLEIRGKKESGATFHLEGKGGARFDWPKNGSRKIDTVPDETLLVDARAKIFSIPKNEYGWLQGLAHFYEGKGSPEQGQSVYSEVIDLMKDLGGVSIWNTIVAGADNGKKTEDPVI